MIDENKLKEWEHITNNASSGPWLFGENTSLSHFHGRNNAKFICAARTAVPELIAEVRKLEKEADWIAQQASKLLGCVKPENMNDAVCSGKLPLEVTADDCVECWRKQAREALIREKMMNDVRVAG